MNALLIKLRSEGRKLGLHRFLYHLRTTLRLNDEYEKHFHKALEGAVRSGDVVWDVGANVGFYTELFCRWVGPTGRVVAFEPNPAACEAIRKRLPACEILTLENIALGSLEGTMSLVVGNEDCPPNAHLMPELDVSSANKFAVPVQVSTGDVICERIGQVPAVIKIDVEGFEDDVLEGLEHTLSSPSVRAVFLEIHFQALEDRGRPNGPIQIENFLKNKGFLLDWIDMNHLKAER